MVVFCLNLSNWGLRSLIFSFNKCVHPTEGRLERREPTGGLFRNVEENLCAIRDSLLPGHETPSGQRAGPTEDVESAHIGFNPGSSRYRRSAFLKRVFARAMGDCRPQVFNAKATGLAGASVNSGIISFQLVCENWMLVRLRMVQLMDGGWARSICNDRPLISLYNDEIKADSSLTSITSPRGQRQKFSYTQRSWTQTAQGWSGDPG